MSPWATRRYSSFLRVRRRTGTVWVLPTTLKEPCMNVGPVLYILIIILVILAIVYLFQRTRGR